MRLIYCFLVLLSSVQLLNAQTPDQLKSWLPEISGWAVNPEIEIFNSDNLFSRINGAAPLYIENNFKEMTSLEYTKGDSYITIQAYRHGTPIDAFGMYSSERSPDAAFFQAGGEAYGEETVACFFAGNMYVKMYSSSEEKTGEILQTIAKKFAEKIDPDANFPTILKAFPEEDKIKFSEAYITSSYIGHEFLNKVAVTQYKKGDEVFQIFIMERESADDAKNVLDTWFKKSGQSGNLKEGAITVKDKYNGDIPVFWKSKYLIGIFSEKSSKMPKADAFLKDIASKL